MRPSTPSGEFAGLIAAFEELLNATICPPPTTAYDNVIINPKSLNGSYAFSLFNEADLTRLDQIASVQDASAERTPPLELPSEQLRACLQVPSNILSCYGRIFTEMLCLLDQN